MAVAAVLAETLAVAVAIAIAVDPALAAGLLLLVVAWDIGGTTALGELVSYPSASTVHE